MGSGTIRQSSIECTQIGLFISLLWIWVSLRRGPQIWWLPEAHSPPTAHNSERWPSALWWQRLDLLLEKIPAFHRMCHPHPSVNFAAQAACSPAKPLLGRKRAQNTLRAWPTACGPLTSSSPEDSGDSSWSAGGFSGSVPPTLSPSLLPFYF